MRCGNEISALLQNQSLQAQHLSDEKVVKRLEFLFHPSQFLGNVELRKQVNRKSHLISLYQLASLYPEILRDPCHLENSVKYLENLLRNAQLINFAILPTEPQIQITTQEQKIVHVLEKLVIDDLEFMFRSREGDRVFVPVSTLLENSPLLRSITKDESEVIRAAKHTTSDKIFLRMSPYPPSIAQISTEELVGRAIDVIFEDFMFIQQKFAKEHSDIHGIIPLCRLLEHPVLVPILSSLNASFEQKLNILRKSIKHNTIYASLSDDEKGVRKRRIEEVVLLATELLFEDQNYYKDHALLELASNHDSGFVPIEDLMHFPTLQSVTRGIDGKKFAKVLKTSKKLIVSDDMQMVRRAFDWALSQAHPEKGCDWEKYISRFIQFLFDDINYPLDRKIRGFSEKYVESWVPLEDILSLSCMKKRLNEIQSEENIEITIDKLVEILRRNPNEIFEVHPHINAIRRIHSFDFRKVVLCGVEANAFDFSDLTSSDSFTVMTYNILADFLGSQEKMFVYASKEAKDWQFRKHGIKKEIYFYNADICCFQEVQTPFTLNSLDSCDHFSWLQHKLSKRNYEGLYKRKSTGKKGLDIGNALFWNTNSFKMVHSFDLELGPLLATQLSDKNIADTYPQIALIAHLDHVPSGRQLLVCCIHLSANFNAQHIQVLQLNICFEKIHKYQQTIGTIAKEQLSLVICGDFNSTPDTPMYEFTRNGKLSTSTSKIISQSASNAKIPNLPPLSHCLSLESSYASVLSGEPKLTHLTEHFSGTLDYIWFSTDTLAVLAVLDIPKMGTMKREVAFPSSRYPSDHIPLIAKFKFKKHNVLSSQLT